MAKQYRVKCHETDIHCQGIVRFNNSTFSVPGILDGETAKIELVYGKDRKSTGAKVAEIEAPSKDRTEPICPVFDRCGGCQLQYAKYEKQLALKQTAVESLLGKFGSVSPILGMTDPLHYRHKIHATFFRGKRGIGLGIYEENTHRVVAVSDCKIQNKQANAILRTIKNLADDFKLTVYNEDSRQGLLRHVLIRVGKETGQIMVVLVLGTTNFPARSHFVDALKKAHPEITTLVQNINNKKTSMVLGDQQTVLYGTGFIEDKLCGLTFRISPKSFYQVNPVQTEVLYHTAIDFAGLTGKETVLDAYCGTGTIGMIAATNASEVIGVESNKDAVRDARANADNNHVKNIRFVNADASEYMTGTDIEKTEVVLMDPPRSGSTPEFLNALCKLAPNRIVYISCNPETQARDLAILTKKNYKVEKIQPVDLFPDTSGIETVVLLKKTV